MTRVVVGTFPSRLEAELAAERLSEHGIPATVFSDDAGGMLPTLQTAGGAWVMVAEADRERARAMLGERDTPEHTPEAPLSTGRRIQGISVALLFAVFVLLLVIYAAVNIPSPE